MKEPVKTKILRLACEQFNHHGYQTLTYRELANLLKLSFGNLTYHFPTKLALHRALFAQQIAIFQEELALLQDPNLTLPAFVQAMNRIHLQNWNLRFFWIELPYFLRADPRISSTLNQVRVQKLEALEPTLTRWINQTSSSSQLAPAPPYPAPEPPTPSLIPAPAPPNPSPNPSSPIALAAQIARSLLTFEETWIFSLFILREPFQPTQLHAINRQFADLLLPCMNPIERTRYHYWDYE
ncbi:MAG: TetR/AcrR family transcriptional regulator [Bacteroidia bacterium]|nr:TetR/AcrR family transcriptional regulator [Bacteroidia bacterium]